MKAESSLLRGTHLVDEPMILIEIFSLYTRLGQSFIQESNPKYCIRHESARTLKCLQILYAAASNYKGTKFLGYLQLDII